MRKKPVKKPVKKEKLEAFLVVCKDGRSRWLSLDLPKVYATEEDAQKAANKRAREVEYSAVLWTVAKFREVA
jgi:hypothetical protein